MLAQIDEILIVAIIAVFGAIIGAIYWLSNHINDSDKHPNKKDIVTEKSCEDRRDCIEVKFESIKELMNERFDNLETLIKNGGQDPPNVIT